MRLLEQDEAEKQAKIEWLRQELIAGEGSGDSDRSIDDIWQEVKACVDTK